MIVINGVEYDLYVNGIIAALRVMANNSQLDEEQCSALVNIGNLGLNRLHVNGQPDIVAIMQTNYGGNIKVHEIIGNQGTKSIREFLADPNGIFILKSPIDIRSYFYTVIGDTVWYMFLDSNDYAIAKIPLEVFKDVVNRHNQLRAFHVAIHPPWDVTIKFQDTSGSFNFSNCVKAIESFARIIETMSKVHLE